MIVKMTILRLLGSSDDKEKEKIGVARPKGGVHPMACDFETNMFSSLSFVVSRGVNTLRECFSRSM